MLLLDRQSAPAPRREAASRIHLRLLPQGQLVDLPLGKTTLGSSPRCNVRLQLPGIEPLHCLVVREEGITVRRWAGEARLNGVSFDEAPLVAGDRLTLGSVEVEILGPQPAAAPIGAAAQPAATETSGAKPKSLLGTRPQLRREVPAPRSLAHESAATSEWQSERPDVLPKQADVADAMKQAHDDEAAAEERQRLADEVSELRQAADEMAAQNAVLADEREVMRRHINRLETQVAEFAQHADVSVEQSALAEECDSLRHQLEELRHKLRASAAERAAAEVLDARLAGLVEENDTLTAAAAEQESELSRLQAENKRLAALEREMNRAAEDRESTAVELSRALMQVSELREREEQHQQFVAAYEALHNDDQQRIDDSTQFEQEIARLEAELIAAAHARQAVDDEFSAITTSHERLADENTRLIARVAELSERLDSAERKQSALAATVSGLERELAANRELEADTQQEIAELESELESRRQAEAAAAATLVEAESRHAEELRRNAEKIERLEQELATSREAAASVAVAADWESPANDAAPVSAAIADEPAEQPWGWTDSPAENPWQPEQAAAPSDESSNATGASSSSVAAHSWAQSFAEPSSFGEQTSIGDDAPEADAWASSPVAEAAEERPAWPTSALTAESTSADLPAAAPIAFAPATMAGEPVAEVKPKTESTSFIERYAHMFTDDGPAADVPPPAKPATSRDGFEPRPRSMGIVSSRGNEPATANDENEESIEQYMAKLLQRVRGDQPRQVASQAMPATEEERAAAVSNYQAALAPTGPTNVANMLSDLAAEKTENAEEDVAPVEIPVEPRRKPQTPAPATDLGPLRALANESARRAIGRHELQKHRRNAVTKLIVSTLAGVTSLWLMLDSPSWTDIQFITACVSLIVAAIWAGETFRTMFESFRAAGYDGPQVESGEVVSADAAPLPIDVESP